MEMDVNLQESHEMANMSRLRILLIDGGVKALKDILVEQLLRHVLLLKKDYLKSKIGSKLYQKQFDDLYPNSDRLPRFEDMDNVILSDIIIKEVLDIFSTTSSNTKEQNIKIIKDQVKKKLLPRHLASKKSFLSNSQKRLGQEQWNILYPTTTAVVNINSFDITLLTFILRTTFDLIPTSGNWKEEPSGGHINVADDIIRLRQHRNSLCHSSSSGINDTEFNNKWADITGILTRLQGPSCRIKIDELKKAALDPIRERQHQKFLNEWYLQDTEVTDHIEKLAEEMQKGYNEFSKRIENLEKSHQKRPTDSMVMYVKHWKENEDVVFHKTRASEAVAKSLDTQNIVTITGAPGCGKSLIAKHIALQYQRQGYDIYPFSKPKEIEEFYCESKKQLFFFDHPVGDLQLNYDSVLKWKRCSENLRIVFKTPNVKCLVTISTNLIKEIGLREEYCVLTDNEINITDGELKLDEEEKNKIFESHCKNDIPLEVATRCPFDCFPFLCHVYCTSGKNEKIFVEPFSAMEKQFLGIYNNKPQFAALLLCSVMKECYEELFDGFAHNERLASGRNEMNKVLSQFGFDSPRDWYNEINNQLDAMCGVFLQKINGTYTFIHPLFKEIVNFIMGKHSSGFIYKYLTGN